MKPSEILELIQEPQAFAKWADLVYVKNDQLNIQRHPHGRGYYYMKEGEKIKDNQELDRFKGLVIPPAWKEVKISSVPKGHLQVVGRDDSNRKVYRYHSYWSKLKNQTKFFKMTVFGQRLPAIRKKVDQDLDQDGMPLTKILALVVRLMEETHIRIGNEYYAKTNKTYGLSTLRTRHVETSKKGVNFHFIGKKGKEHNIEIDDKELIALIEACEDIPGWELFKYFDDDKTKKTIDSGMVNDYIHEIAGDYFSAKDFRTWSGSKIFFETIHNLPEPETKKAQKKNILKAYDTVADALGNTRSVCRDYYVHPIIPEYYENGKIEPYFDQLEEKHSTKKPFFSHTETIMLKLMDDFEIKEKQKL